MLSLGYGGKIGTTRTIDDNVGGARGMMRSGWNGMDLGKRPWFLYWVWGFAGGGVREGGMIGGGGGGGRQGLGVVRDKDTHLSVFSYASSAVISPSHLISPPSLLDRSLHSSRVSLSTPVAVRRFVACPTPRTGWIAS